MLKSGKELGWHPGTVLHPIQLNYPYLATTIYPNVIIVRDLRDGREVTRYVGDEEYLLPTACWVSSRAERLVTIYGRKVQVVDTREEEGYQRVETDSFGYPHAPFVLLEKD